MNGIQSSFGLRGGLTGNKNPNNSPSLGQGGFPEPKKTYSSLNDLLELYGPLAFLQAKNSFDNADRAFGAQNRAFDFLSPENMSLSAMRRGDRIRNQARSSGNRSYMEMLSRGYGTGAAQGARVDSLNRGNEGANQMFLNETDPATMAQRSLAQSQVYDPNGALQMLLGIQNAANNQRVADAQYNASKPPSFLESVLGFAGSLGGLF